MLGIFLDTETNGLNPFKHKTIEIAFEIVDLLTGRCLESFEAVVATTQEEWALSDKESLKINGSTWDRVFKGQSSIAVGLAIQHLFSKHKIQRGKAIFLCQNPSFDRVFFSQLVDPDLQEALSWPYHWLDLASMYWALAMRKATPHPEKLPWDTGVSKDNIAAVYSLPKETQPHQAMNGVKHLLLCYQSVVGFPNQTC